MKRFAWMLVLLLLLVGCDNPPLAKATVRQLAMCRAATAGLFVFDPSARETQPTPAPAPTPVPDPAPTPPEPIRIPEPPPEKRHDTSALGPASPAWTWPGEIRQHLATTHGVQGAYALTSAQAVELHNRLHNAAATKRVALPQTVWRSSCPGGVCQAPTRTIRRGVFRRR